MFKSCYGKSIKFVVLDTNPNEWGAIGEWWWKLIGEFVVEEIEPNKIPCGIALFSLLSMSLTSSSLFNIVSSFYDKYRTCSDFNLSTLDGILPCNLFLKVAKSSSMFKFPN
jgi:hypothetical protein